VHLSSSRVTLAASLIAIAAACAGPEPFREGVRISDRLYPGAVGLAEGGMVMRLVDDLTGQPLAGAEVFLVPEHEAPIAGEFWFTSRFVSDAEGFVRLEVPPGSLGFGWIAVRHPTCGVDMRMQTDDVMRVGRGFDVPVRILDWLGRPQPGARVGFCGGCGHSPDLVNAAADQDGIAVLHGIDPKNGIADIYVQHPGLHLYYDSVDWRPGEPPMDVLCDPSPRLSGRVIDHRGQPVAGVCVMGGGIHRGPWGRTAIDGRFTILGAEWGDYPGLLLLPGDRKVFFDTSRAWPVTMRLPDLADPAAFEGTLEDQPPPPPEVAGRDLRVVIEGGPARLGLEVWAPGLVQPEHQDADALRVPARDPFVLVATDDADEHSMRRRYTFADAGAVPDPLVLQWLPPPRIIGRVVGPDGRATAARVQLRNGGERDEVAWHECQDGAFALEATRSRRQVPDQFVEIVPADPALWPRLVPVTVPEPGVARTVDLGELRLQVGPQLRVVDAAGTPMREAKAACGRAGWQTVDEWPQWPLDENGVWRGQDLRAGDSVVIEREHHLAFRTVLQGDGPWTLTMPAGLIDILIVTADGAPLHAMLVVGDESVETESGHARLRGLRPGPTRIWVSAAGHRSAVVDAVVSTAPQAVQVVLPPR
jgi:hypothetical protein